MWFRNLQLLRLAPGIAIDPDVLNQKLAERRLIACGGIERKRIGWVPAHGEAFAHHQGGHILVAMGIEEKLLPVDVVKQEADKKITSIAEQEGYRPGSRRQREIREQVEDELLPRAFARRTTVHAWIDPINGWLAVDAASIGKAEALSTLLAETLPDLPIRLPNTRMSPGAAMTAWLMEDAPDGFTIDRDGELRLPGEDRATVRYVHHALDGSEIAEHICAGKQVTRLGLTWSGRVSFLLTDKFEIKRLQFLDVVKEQSNQAEDAEALFQAEFALMVGELAKLIDGLVEACGGLDEDVAR
jgi:recombination associated protein RdgC